MRKKTVSKYNIRWENKVLGVFIFFIFLFLFLIICGIMGIIIAIVGFQIWDIFNLSGMICIISGSCIFVILSLLILVYLIYEFLTGIFSIYDLFSPYKFSISGNYLKIHRIFKRNNIYKINTIKCRYYYPIGRLIIIRKSSKKQYRFLVPDMINFLEVNNIKVEKKWDDKEVHGWFEKSYRFFNQFNKRMDKNKME